MRNSSWKHAKHRRNTYLKSRRRFNLERSLGLLEDGEQFSHAFSKKSLACSCAMCKADGIEWRKLRNKLSNALADIRWKDYQLELK